MQICRLALAPLLLILLVATPSLADDAVLRDLISRFQREKSEPVTVRTKVLEEIANVGTDRAVRFLVDVIDQEDEEFGVRSRAIYQLARVPRRSAFGALQRLWKRSPDNLKINVLSATLASRTEPGVRDMIEDALASRTANVRARLLAWFGESGDERFFPEAERYLADFPGHANALVNGLVKVRTPDSARLLLRIYDDTEKHHVNQITPVFTRGDEDVQKVLVEGLESGDERLETKAIALAARSRAGIAEPALVALLDGAAGERRSALIGAIGAVGAKSEAGRAAILEALQGEDQAAAIAAARAIRATPGKEPIPLLIRALSGAEGTLRTEIRVTLEEFTGQQYGERADLWRRWWDEHGEAFDPENIRREGRPKDIDIALVNLAVDKGVLALKSLRGEREPWKYSSQPVGTTALVCLALHAAGLDPREDPDLRAGIAYLTKASVPAHTYTQSLVAMALEANGAKRHKRQVIKAGKALVATQLESGLWAYPGGNDGDNSNAQYAVLGLRAAARAGMRVPNRTWQRVRDHFLDTRCKDGGWPYRPLPSYPSSASMTAGGVSSLLICLENMKLDDAERAELVAAIDAGFEALGAKMKLEKDTLYTLYGIERAGILGKRPLIGGKRWYDEGARRLVAEQAADGTWTGYYREIVETCFAILFLKKATVPVTTK